MRRLILALFVCLCATCFAQTQIYRTTGYAEKELTSYGWTSWSQWYSSDLRITMNLDLDVITIYAPSTQRLKVISDEGSYIDESGGKNVKFFCHDMVDDLPCYVRLRIERNGNSQIYVEWRNVIIVYNVVRIE